jgi:hypothetical protein
VRVARAAEVPEDAALLPAVESPDAYVRAGAALALAHAPGRARAARALLRPLLADPEARVLLAALDAVAALRRNADVLTPRVRALLDASDVAVARAARRALDAMALPGEPGR